ncbi:MAG: alkaline phosphatase family protein [Candidatus Saccharicenans sp.]|jgi:predicted AlkP superfamily phosphohydrolase/phosphomutase|nr:alkaline phosphatase family protein [Candidatus Saccharicenans sp.]MDH7493497.1 alkaline phosphatase family protein [Candidatus Saccharicenans sp.]
MTERKNEEALGRREFLQLVLGTSAGLLLAPGKAFLRTVGRKETGLKVLVLGMDGLDTVLLQRYLEAGLLPHFQKLAASGTFRPLRSSIPPQSPVAWANFITGTNPGGHAIFDFVHRDPQTYLPVFSASESLPARHQLRLGQLTIPLSGGEIRNLRRGRAFWQILEEYDIPATIFKIPSNYPPVETRQRTFSGMGTPDLKGYYGLFNYYTNEYKTVTEEYGGGGRVHDVYVIGNRVEARIPGPNNPFKKGNPETYVDFKVFIDPVQPVAKIAYQDQEFILREKEWSGWKKIRFEFIPTQSVSGICLFYLKEVRPKFKLYVSPINIDPADPALPLSTPESYSRQLAQKFGPFFTKGLPADTAALENDVLDEKEFLQQDELVYQESMAMLEEELNNFRSGLLFFYFSNTDQSQHMFFRLIDRDHPAYDEKLAAEFGRVIENTYRQMDRALQLALEKVDRQTVVVVMSDHGFCPFRRGFNLNTWLLRNGYHVLRPGRRPEEVSLFQTTDWSRTRAYGVGLNALYLNLKGREAQGIVRPEDKEPLLRELAYKLEQVSDPLTGERVILKAYLSQDVFSGAHLAEAPDIILGFNRNYRISWNSPLGSFPRELIENNPQKWSGDHMTAPDLIPGVLLANRPARLESPALEDVTAGILSLFGVKIPPDISGRPVF